MLHRILSAILEVGSVSEFETYCMSIQRSGLSGVPTAEEAKKDYEAVARPHSIVWAF